MNPSNVYVDVGFKKEECWQWIGDTGMTVAITVGRLCCNSWQGLLWVPKAGRTPPHFGYPVPSCTYQQCSLPNSPWVSPTGWKQVLEVRSHPPMWEQPSPLPPPPHRWSPWNGRGNQGRGQGAAASCAATSGSPQLELGTVAWDFPHCSQPGTAMVGSPPPPLPHLLPFWFPWVSSPAWASSHAWDSTGDLWLQAMGAASRWATLLKGGCDQTTELPWIHSCLNQHSTLSHLLTVFGTSAGPLMWAAWSYAHTLLNHG